jgi:23S rRNA (cytosine1962-C5)-methyltransferase
MRIFLKRGRANPLWHGHPWVYSGAVEREEGSAEPGAPCAVCDHDGRLIGHGLWNPRSQIRVRMMTWRDEPIDAALVKRRVEEAVALRQKLGLPSPASDAYRLINSEGDALPGVIVDVYGKTAAVQFTALGMKRLDAALFDALPFENVVEVAAGGFSQVEGFSSSTRTVRGQATARCRENGVELDVEPLHGQKTGYFVDQRENRRRVAELARGARVLDVYTYAGGFALAALKGGATSAVCVDSSARALERARHHAQLNGVSLDTIENDAFCYLETVTPRSFDLVILDPPKFARAKKDLDAAMKGYQRLNALGLNACAEGALLVTCSCSQLVGEELFERAVAGAARDAGRRVQVLESRSQAPDHPVPPAFPEGRYLKALFCRVL